MRFDDFVSEHAVTVAAVDQFSGYVVRVGLPASWVPFDAAVGLRVWVCRSGPRIDEFCSNAVLTMHSVDAALDAREVFGMLIEQQLHFAPNGRERLRELAPASEGAGMVGMVAMHIPFERGTVASESRSRIIVTEEQTLVAQLTVTALQDSPLDRASVWMTVREGAAAHERS